MAGSKINICFWYVDDSLIGEIIDILKNGSYEPDYCSCKEIIGLKAKLKNRQTDLIISDFDLPDSLRDSIEGIHNSTASHVPLIYLVGEKNEKKAAETLKRGVWDYLLKDHFIKLVPTVYSSQKYGKVLKYSRKIEDQLEESESRYHSIFNTVKDGIVLINTESLNIIDYNQSILSIFGFESETNDENVFQWLTEEIKSNCKRNLEEITKGLLKENSVSYLCQSNKVNGDVFWTENTVSLFKTGRDAHYVLVIRNIQEQKIIEESLRKSREHFQNLAENSPDIIMRFDNDLKHIYVNQTVYEMLEIPVEDFINKTHQEMGIFPDELVSLWEKAINTVFETGKTNSVEFDLQGKSGIIKIEWRLFPEYDEDGNTQTVLAISRDITEMKKAGEALETSEERLNLAVDATSLGLWDWNLDTNEIFYSPGYFKMLGYGPLELPHKIDTWKMLMHEDDRAVSIEYVEKCIKDREEIFDLEFRMLSKDGTYKWIHGRAKVSGVRDDGSTKRLIGTHEDITLRKRERDVQEVVFNISNAVNTTKNLSELYESIRDFLGKIIDTTNCFLAIYNDETNMLSLPFHRDEVDSFNEFPAGKTLTGYVISSGKTQLVDAEREKQLTEEGHIELVGSPSVSWLGVPLKTNSKIIGVFVVQSYRKDVIFSDRDVCILEFVSDQIALAIERKRDQDNLRESQEKQRRVFESSPDPIMVVNKKGLIMDYNTSLLSALHITNETVIGQNVFHFIDKRQRRYAIRNFKKTWDEGYVKNLEFKTYRADGSSFDSEVSTGSIFNNEGEPESIVVIFKDVTERKESERNLRKAKEKAEESDRLKTAFLSNMSHEIRTPMNAIVGFSDLLNDENIQKEERKEFIAQINLGADNLMHLIDDIIDIAKIEAGQIIINKDECNLKSLVEDQVVMFKQHSDRLDKSGIELRLNWKFSEDTLVLNTDPFRVKQIITNLMNNAIKFTDSGFVELGVEKDGDNVRIYVQDSGIGIVEEKQHIIFDRFMQGHKSKTKLYGGTGLGLAISKNLSELLGGNIGVNSTPGEGSTFWFTLPLDSISGKILEENPDNEASTINWTGKKILVAEDDVSNYYLISEVLKFTNAEIIWAKDGEQTIKLFEEHKNSLSLVLMDIQMPEIDGYECTRIIKKKKMDIPVIAQTAFAMSGEKEMAFEAGCDDYIRKPLEIRNLIEKLDFYLK